MRLNEETEDPSRSRRDRTEVPRSQGHTGYPSPPVWQRRQEGEASQEEADEVMKRGDAGVWWPLRLHADTLALDPHSFSILLKERVVTPSH